MTKEWVSTLPLMQKSYQRGTLLSHQTWFQVGGAAELFFKPQTCEDLILFLKEKPKEIPLTFLGAGSNVLISDQGIAGVVIRLGRGFSSLHIEGTRVTVGAAALDRTVALTCADAGLSGLEFLIGIPGTIGGAVKMNAGCYGGEIKDTLIWVDIITDQGEIRRLTKADLAFSYRQSALSSHDMVITACFDLQKESPIKVHEHLTSLLQKRSDSQPIKGRTGGSTFKNPFPCKAWELIDGAGCRGLIKGKAQISEKHCNFLLNLGGATAQDLLDLGNHVRQKVKEKYHLFLEWEIIRLGIF